MTAVYDNTVAYHKRQDIDVTAESLAGLLMGKRKTLDHIVQHDGEYCIVTRVPLVENYKYYITRWDVYESGLLDKARYIVK